MRLHQGEIVELAIRRNSINISEISRRMNVNRRSIYNWFRRDSLKIETICEIGYIINYDFSQDFPNEFAKDGFAIVERFMNEKNGITDPVNSVHFWMNKYITLLEIHNDMLSAQNLEPENLTLRDCS
jgi:hypothetical protein